MNKIIFVGVYYIFIILLFFVILLFALVKLKQDVKDNQHDNDVKQNTKVGTKVVQKGINRKKYLWKTSILDTFKGH